MALTSTIEQRKATNEINSVFRVFQVDLTYRNLNKVIKCGKKISYLLLPKFNIDGYFCKVEKGSLFSQEQ